MLHQSNGNALECLYTIIDIITLLYRKRASLDDDARGSQHQEGRIAHKQRTGRSSTTLFAASQAFISAIKDQTISVCAAIN